MYLYIIHHRNIWIVCTFYYWPYTRRIYLPYLSSILIWFFWRQLVRFFTVGFFLDWFFPNLSYLKIIIEPSKYFPRSLEHVLNTIYHIIIKSVDTKRYTCFFLVDVVRWESCGIWNIRETRVSRGWIWLIHFVFREACTIFPMEHLHSLCVQTKKEQVKNREKVAI